MKLKTRVLLGNEKDSCMRPLPPSRLCTVTKEPTKEVFSSTCTHKHISTTCNSGWGQQGEREELGGGAGGGEEGGWSGNIHDPLPILGGNHLVERAKCQT